MLLRTKNRAQFGTKFGRFIEIDQMFGQFCVEANIFTRFYFQYAEANPDPTPTPLLHPVCSLFSIGNTY